MQAVDTPQVVQPPYLRAEPSRALLPEIAPDHQGPSPFRPCPADQVGRAGSILKVWQADPTRVRRLCGQAWIRETLAASSTDNQVLQIMMDWYDWSNRLHLGLAHDCPDERC